MSEPPCFDWNVKTTKSFAGSSPWRGCSFFFHFSVHSTFLWALQAFLEVLSAAFPVCLPWLTQALPINHGEGAERSWDTKTQTSFPLTPHHPFETWRISASTDAVLNAGDALSWPLPVLCVCVEDPCRAGDPTESLPRRSRCWRWPRRWGRAPWTSATRPSCPLPPARPRGRCPPLSAASRHLTAPHSTPWASRKLSSSSAAPTTAPGSKEVRQPLVQAWALQSLANVFLFHILTSAEAKGVECVEYEQKHALSPVFILRSVFLCCSPREGLLDVSIPFSFVLLPCFSFELKEENAGLICVIAELFPQSVWGVVQGNCSFCRFI